MKQAKKKLQPIKYRWALAKVGDPCVLMRYTTKEQAERNKGNRIDLEVREVIG